MSRLIWFVHFHKAGGSTLVRLARENGEKLYPNHANGNPLHRDGKDVRTWEMSAEALDRFVDESIEMGVTFVASEWFVPNLEVLAARDDVVLITLIRDPVTRFGSNYAFDRRHGFTRKKTLEGYLDDPYELHAQANFYTRALSGSSWRIDTAEESKLAMAEERLRLIDLVAPLEAPDVYRRVCSILGWEFREIHEKNSRLSLPMKALMVLRRLRRGRLDLIRQVIRPPRVTDTQRDFIRTVNAIDVRLYDTVVSRWGA